MLTYRAYFLFHECRDVDLIDLILRFITSLCTWANTVEAITPVIRNDTQKLALNRFYPMLRLFGAAERDVVLLLGYRGYNMAIRLSGWGLVRWFLIGVSMEKERSGQ